MVAKEKTAELGERRAGLQHGGAARDRIAMLLDPGSFVELGAFAKKRPTELDIAREDVPAESVVTGFGTVMSRPVYVFSQDIAAMGGALSEMHAKKITAVYDLAAKTGGPVVGFYDSKGARLAEGVDAMNGYAEMIAKAAALSGVVPQISIVCGICGGAAAIAASTADFIIMSGGGELYMHSPTVVSSATGKDPAASGAALAASGAAAFAFDSDGEAIGLVKKLLQMLPDNCEDGAYLFESPDDDNRLVDLSKIFISETDALDIDMRALVAAIADDGEYIEPWAAYGASITTAFICVGGMIAGVVAANGELCADCASKAAGFVNFCDAFNIPLVTLVNTPGYKTSACFEKSGGIQAAAQLSAAFAAASVPKVTLVAGRAYGSGYVSMCPKGLGADLVYAWPGAQISIMSPQSAAVMMYADEVAKAADPVAKRAEITARFGDTLASPYEAAARGYVDDIIDPAETRKVILYSLDMLSSKKDGCC